jgi:cytochrome c
MKKPLLIIGCLAFALASCSSPDSSSKNAETTNATSTGTTDTSATTSVESPSTTAATGGSAAGKQLIAKADCLGCHNETQKIVGPAYVAVAEKYTQSDLDYLAGKIIKGGSGVWGQVPMSPHPTLSKEDATQMAQYILSLKK